MSRPREEFSNVTVHPAVPQRNDPLPASRTFDETIPNMDKFSKDLFNRGLNREVWEGSVDSKLIVKADMSKTYLGKFLRLRCARDQSVITRPHFRPKRAPRNGKKYIYPVGFVWSGQVKGRDMRGPRVYVPTMEPPILSMHTFFHGEQAQRRLPEEESRLRPLVFEEHSEEGCSNRLRNRKNV